MKRRLVGVSVLGCVLTMLAGPAGVAASGPSAGPVSGAQRVSRKDVSTLNWSGYAVYRDGTTFSHVAGDWIQPTIPSGACPKQKTQLAAFFVGIDGNTSSSVEQIGTEADCLKGQPVYYAWYEMYPAPPTILDCDLQGGDSIHGEVQYNSGTTFTLTLTVNGSSCFSGSLDAPVTPERSSAEWIAEAPATGNHFWPLTNFQSITFSNASATGNNTTGAIDATSWDHDALTMVDRGRPFKPSTIKAEPGPLNGTGDQFTIFWRSS